MAQGMWRKQELFGGTRLDKWVEYDSPFILWGARILEDKVPTDLGEATKTELLVSSLDAAEHLEYVGTLASPIAEMAAEAVPTDFPSIVKVVKVPSSFRKGEGDVATSLERVSEFVPPADWTPVMKDGAPIPDEIQRHVIPSRGGKKEAAEAES